MKGKIKKIAIIVLIIALGAVAILGIRRIRTRPVEIEEKDDLGVPVMSQTLVEEDLRRIYRYSGTAEYENRTRISPRIAKEIDDFLIEEGDRITAEEELVRLDDEEIRSRKQGVKASVKEAELMIIMAESSLSQKQSDLKGAEADLREARSNYEKWQRDLEADRRLYQDNAISKAELEETETRHAAAEAKYIKAEASVERAEIAVSMAETEIQQYKNKLEKSRSELAVIETQLSYTVLKSPLDGEVIDKIPKPGEYVNPGEPVLEVADTDNLVITSKLGMKDFTDIDTHTEVEVKIPHLSEKPLTGEITNLKSLTDPHQRTTEVTVSLLEDPPEKLKEGMYTSVLFYPESRSDVITVPRNSLFFFEEAPHVYVIKDGQAKRREVETGLDTGHRVEIKAGLEKGEEIVTSNIEELRDGVSIYLRDEDEWGN
ncbi:efflux RND transporter periplasmic adaptor subunit [Halarsenatibacter silvermanii]|uniref:RND family efflux transporter, MFP subunit n=1 Tax=Halarsenatibacter silvermanii TaxID=321763 RepID=A0A1G9IC50_9FIRM|nr:efflux RND transporter periplasmic adaptor subunit [Halarsenatibacter silvermanii]SDL22838.1 RND family efflux transporter, MFP subunit [Halarsenatibacter silvermanii]